MMGLDMTFPVLELSGAPFEMGFAHGRAFADAIRRYAEERIALACSPGWTGRSASRTEVLGLAEACVPLHHEFSPDLGEELDGMAAASGVSVAELIVVGGFTDFIDTVANPAATAATGTVETDGAPGAPSVEGVNECTAFLVPGGFMADGVAALAQTWDMHEGSADHLVLLRGRPRGAPAFLAYTTAGAPAMIGMNELGLSVGINNLMAADGGVGVTWPVVVREMLKCETLDEALAVLARAPLAGGHNYLIMDAEGRGANVEAMGSRSAVTELAERPLAHTNHCLAPSTKAVERQRDAASQADSEARLADAERLLQRSALSIDDLQSITADSANICHAGVAPRFVGTCGAVVMRPGTRELWAVKGRPSERAYQRFAFAATSASATVTPSPT